MDKYEHLKQKMFRKYSRFPKMAGNNCEKACASGKCKFECCTVSGCSEKERRLINKYIKRNKLELPLTNEVINKGYIMPSIKEKGGFIDNTDIDDFVEGKIKNQICAYLGDKGCKIYEVRPAICRLFGAIKQMPCEHFPEEAKSDLPAREALINI